jgi:hypothetical protein
MPASVVTERFDILAWNAAYAALFPRHAEAPPPERNAPAGPLTRRARAIFLRSRNGEPKAAQTITSRSRLTVSHQFLRSPGEPLSVDLHWIIPQAQVVT